MLMINQLIVFTGTVYIEGFNKWAKILNVFLQFCGLKAITTKSTFPPYSRILFNNIDKSREYKLCTKNKCILLSVIEYTYSS